ncbi:hypothetical protein [Gordonia sp. (in: high G+C Gram-positive bacteria)]|uniref:hypothetical protein n=1 Tax=Gordonia sp. (in: high G+C Gram-positive bacteria) TaxID=84139 RepID=UPI003F9A5A76
MPATWADSEAQAKIALDPVLKGTTEGRKLANMLLDLGFNLDLTLLSRGVLGALTRFMLGDRIAGELRIPREPVWDPLLETAWGPFILVREGVLQAGMPKEATGPSTRSCASSSFSTSQSCGCPSVSNCRTRTTRITSSPCGVSGQ